MGIKENVVVIITAVVRIVWFVLCLLAAIPAAIICLAAGVIVLILLAIALPFGIIFWACRKSAWAIVTYLDKF